MIALPTLLALAAGLAIPIAWLLPARAAFDGVALWTAVVLALVSWPTALGLILVTILVCVALPLGDRYGHRDAVAAIIATTLVTLFVVAQRGSIITWIGTGFFVLRLLHLVGDWWTGTHVVPTLRRSLRYQLFLPVLFIGPVNRIQHFERQIERRRWDEVDFLTGAERVLIGFFMAGVVGEYGRQRLQGPFLARWPFGDGFALDWAVSALDWIALYFVFAGLTSVALGIALMMGLRLEENFDRPWRARSLVDFWTRWHMSLTRWCRDYVFKPVTALTRSPVAGLCAAMLVIGLWHELSLYYLLWAVWQALGVLISRGAAPAIPQPLRRWLGSVAPALILGWLSLARPVITRLLGVPA